MTTESSLTGPQRPRPTPRVSPPKSKSSAVGVELWLKDHAHEYKGQWVALVGTELVDHDVNLKMLVDRLEKRGLSQDAVLNKILPEGFW